MTHVGTDLKDRRERLGLTLGEVAVATRISEDALEALEEGAVHQLPPGPYADAYARAVEGLYARLEAGDDPGPRTVVPGVGFDAPRPTGGVPTPEGDDGSMPSDPVIHTRPAPERAPPSTRVPLVWIRRLALASTAAFVLLLAWQAREEVRRAGIVAAAAGPQPFQVEVTLKRNAHLRVVKDGAVVADRLFAGGTDVTWAARRELVLDVPATEALAIRFDGRRVDPRGLRNTPRRLVFVSDGEAGR